VKNLPFIFIWLTTFVVMSQDKTLATVQTLDSCPYDCLDKKIEESADLKAALPYLKVYLSRALSEGNGEEIVNGYKNFLHASPQEQRLLYADSMVFAATNTHNNEIIAGAYLTKGIVYFSRKEHVNALDNYLLANRYLQSSDDLYLKNKVKYNIANIKYYLGFYHEAIALYIDCQAFFKNENPMGYLSCLHSLGLCYNKVRNYKQSLITNEFALRESERLETPEMIPYINLSQGVNKYFLKKYAASVKQISNALQAITKDGDFSSESVAYFYLGKDHMALKNRETALSYFKKVDTVFEKRGYLHPDLRESYEILIRNSREQKNMPGELHYINRLLKADSLLTSKYRSLSEKIHKDYDTAELLKAKSDVELQLSNKKMVEQVFICLLAVLFFVLLYLVYRYFRIRSQYTKRFEELLRSKDIENKEVQPVKPSNVEMITLTLKPEVIVSIMGNLEKFEQRRGYLQKDLTVGKVAEGFNTNAKYLSKVIMACKGKKFITYINDLKVDYIMDLLKAEGKYRMYTNKALAEEAGFSTTQHFTMAFVKKTQLTPTFFVTELKKVYIES
jgi:AraC-like DNA-binding protein